MMSVLNQSGEEQVECPLCMEPLEVDDLNFFPCTCGYQICRFCWHRIRTDENGLCPACRKAYSENPADFTPLSKEQVAQLKAEKRQRDQQRKAKLSESRKHLASVRVVQRNLVFVVGLPMRLADPEILKKHEYFGKFGKIHKVVINQSTAYAGTQGPSASAYVTYMKSDDALRAIQSVNNTTLDGKTMKTSLGTTKYCSHFMKNQPCPKPDCMYLHDFGDQEASFTKEQMHAGKHQEYEKKLHEALVAKQAAAALQLQQQQQQQQQQAQNTSNNSNGSILGNGNNGATTTQSISNHNQPLAPTHTNHVNNSTTTNQQQQQQQQNNQQTNGKTKETHQSCSTASGTSTPSNLVTSTIAIQIGNVSMNGKDGGNWPHLDKMIDSNNKTDCNNKKANGDNTNNKHEKIEKSEKSQKSKKKNAMSLSVSVAETNNKNKKIDDGKDKEKRLLQFQQSDKLSNEICSSNNNNNNTIKRELLDDNLSNDKVYKLVSHSHLIKQDHHQAEDKLSSIDDNSSFFTQNTFSCAKLPSAIVDDEPTSLLSRQINGQEPLLEMIDSDTWDFDFGYTNHSNHLEELAKQRVCRQSVNQSVKDPLESFANGFGGLDPYAKLDSFIDRPFESRTNTESLLESLAKKSVNYQSSMHPTTQHQTAVHQQQQQQVQQAQHQNLSRHFPNGHKDAGLLTGLDPMGLMQQDLQHQTNNAFPKIFDFYRNMFGPGPQQQQQLLNGQNGYHNSYAQQQQPQPQQQQHHYNHFDKHIALLQQQQQQAQQRQIEENLLSLTLGKQIHQQQQQQQRQQTHQHGYSQLNGHYDASLQNGPGFSLGGFGSATAQPNPIGSTHSGPNPKSSRPVLDEKDLDYRFQEAEKALEALVESDSHNMHNTGRTTLGSNQLNGLALSQSGNHLPPPPPGFVQPNTHMNSFGSKILPYLNMNSQQQQQINSTQNNWPSSFSQLQQQQQQQSQHKGMGVCNDWKVLDPAILSSRRHIPSMGPLIDQYSPQAQQSTMNNIGPLNVNGPQQQPQQQPQPQQPRSYDLYATFSNYSNPLQPTYNNGYNTHLSGQPNLNWLGNELNGPISTPPGFRASGQATKQQEC